MFVSLCGADSQSLDHGMQQGFGNSEEVSVWATPSVEWLVLSCPLGLLLTASTLSGRRRAGGGRGRDHAPVGGVRVRADRPAAQAGEQFPPTTALIPRCPRAARLPGGRL